MSDESDFLLKHVCHTFCLLPCPPVVCPRNGRIEFTTAVMGLYNIARYRVSYRGGGGGGGGGGGALGFPPPQNLEVDIFFDTQ